MGAWDRIRNVFKNEDASEDNPNVTTVDVSSSTTWNSCKEDTVMWQLQYAFAVVANMLKTFFVNADWKTYKSGKPIKGEEWFRFNVAPNRRQTSADFYGQLAVKLIYEGQALIIETSKGELFVADSFTFKDGQELMMKENTFTNVVLGTTTLNRSFKENDSCIFIKTPNYDRVKLALESMGVDFLELKKLIYEGAQKALGMKLALNLGAQAKNKYDSKYIRQIQTAYDPLMKARDAVFVTYKGEVLSDLTEKQRGSEVQQVLDAVENNIRVNNEVVCNVGIAFGLPQKFMRGDLTADNDSIFDMAITLFAKPYLTLLSQKFTYFVLTKEDIIGGGKIEAELSSIKFIERLAMATAVDKLIGSGAYNINEVREMLDDDPVENGDVRFITKNYAVLSEYVKGGNNTT